MKENAGEKEKEKRTREKQNGAKMSGWKEENGMGDRQRVKGKGAAKANNLGMD